MTKESCAFRIKKALNMRNMKQSELSSITKIPKSAISQYISGAFEPKQDRVELIAKALNVSEAWLMGYDVPMSRESESIYDSSKPYSNLTKKQKKLLSITEKLTEEQIDDVIQYGLSLDIMNQVRAIKEEQKNIHYGQVVAYGGTNSPVVETKEQEEEIAKLLEEIRQEKNKKIEK